MHVLFATIAALAASLFSTQRTQVSTTINVELDHAVGSGMRLAGPIFIPLPAYRPHRSSIGWHFQPMGCYVLYCTSSTTFTVLVLPIEIHTTPTSFSPQTPRSYTTESHTRRPMLVYDSVMSQKQNRKNEKIAQTSHSSKDLRSGTFGRLHPICRPKRTRGRGGQNSQPQHGMLVCHGGARAKCVIVYVLYNTGYSVHQVSYICGCT